MKNKIQQLQESMALLKTAILKKAEQMEPAQDENYSKDYNDFLSSDEIKDLKGRDRLKAVQDWKNNYSQPKQPDFMQFLNEDQIRRLQHINAAHANQGIARKPKKKVE